MKLSVKLFARARELARRDVVVVDVPEPCTVAELRDGIAQSEASLGEFVRRCAVAVNGEYAVDGDNIPSGADVALIPPVSGG